MLLFAFYAVGIWYAIYKTRRTLMGVCWLVGGTLFLVGVGYFHYKLQEWTPYDIYLPVLQVLLYPYTALVIGVGGFFVTLPKAGCRVCGYDAASVTTEGICPECGSTPEERSTRKGRRTARRRHAQRAFEAPPAVPGIRLASKESRSEAAQHDQHPTHAKHQDRHPNRHPDPQPSQSPA